MISLNATKAVQHEVEEMEKEIKLRAGAPYAFFVKHKADMDKQW
jgi:hypothetical protein